MRSDQVQHFREEECMRNTSSFGEFVIPYLKKEFIALDLGAGAGFGSVAIAGFVDKVIVTDNDEEMIRVAQETLTKANITNAEFRRMAAESVNLDADTIDAVIIRSSLHHFDNPFKALQEAYRVLKSGGILCIEDAVLPEPVLRIWSITSLIRHGKWANYLSYRQLMDILANAKFCIIGMQPCLIEQWLDDFFASAPEDYREILAILIQHLTPEERALMHFQKTKGKIKFAYDACKLAAIKVLD